MKMDIEITDKSGWRRWAAGRHGNAVLGATGVALMLIGALVALLQS